MQRLSVILAATAAALAACGGPSPGEGGELPAPSAEQFTAQIQPLLEEACANPSCHGNAERPLSLYATYKYRLDPGRTFITEPCTADEVQHNYDVVRGFLDPEEPGASPLLCKPLSRGAGGCFHGGDDVFATTTDPRFEVLRAWVIAAR